VTRRKKSAGPAGPGGEAEPPIAAWTQREHPEWLDEQAWAEWRALCALGLCRHAVQESLASFAGFHFRRLVSRYAFRVNAPGEARALTDRDGWHLFETHLTARQTREGKRYKDWLFARVPPDANSPMQAVAGGAVLLMRDAAREYLAREFAPAGQVSLSSPVNSAESGRLALEDLLPDAASPADEVARREYEALAREHAEEWFAALGARDRMLLLARHMGLPLNHPVVEQAAGCRKSKACASLRNFVENLAADLRRQFADDPAESVRLLATLTLEALNQRIDQWGRQEPRCADLFSLASRHEETTPG